VRILKILFSLLIVLCWQNTLATAMKAKKFDFLIGKYTIPNTKRISPFRNALRYVSLTSKQILFFFNFIFYFP